MDVDGELQVTNSFPFPSAEVPPTDDKHDSTSGAAAAPRAKSTVYYQTEMVRCLREMNVDANSIGWYQSASLGNFVSPSHHRHNLE
jgi:translation initiation factor 3 subunit H